MVVRIESRIWKLLMVIVQDGMEPKSTSKVKLSAKEFIHGNES